MRPGTRSRQPGSLALWFGVLAGPIAWTAHLLVSYPLVYVACATGLAMVINLITLVTLLITAVGGYVAFLSFRRAERQTRASFMALLGVLVSGLFFYVIVLEGLPALILGPCWTG